jgi:DNA-binding MurR/RpiR family transcriptional regulator
LKWNAQKNKTYLPERYIMFHKYHAKGLLDSFIVDNYEEAELLQNSGSCDTVFVISYRPESYDIPRMIELARQMDANILEFLCCLFKV